MGWRQEQEQQQQPGGKSLWKALFLWATGGLFGLHHVYLERDRHAFVCWSSFGGMGLAWLADLFSLPRYVREANLDPSYLEEFTEKLRTQPKPSFSVNRFTSAILTAYCWGYLYMSAVPIDEFAGVNWKFLYWFTPIPVTLGIWTVGNIGRQTGGAGQTFLTCLVVSPLRYWLADDTWLTLMVVCSALVFDSYSKQWRRKLHKKRSLCRRLTVLTACAMIYMSLWIGFFYFNGTITDVNGDEIPVHEAVYHFFTSPWWVDLKQSLYDTYIFAQHHGWYQIWLQIIDLSDPLGEQNAYKVLGVSKDASQQEITSAWRRLSRDHHPDKERDPTLREETQKEFLDIQQAYNLLSNTRSRRNRKNKKDNADFT